MIENVRPDDLPSIAKMIETTVVRSIDVGDDEPMFGVYELTGEERYRELAVSGFEGFANSLGRRPTAVPRMLSALAL